jgi:uncharacterized 2Fe-2S/4Fe-4S cluster protein (DUF4445 family)
MPRVRLEPLGTDLDIAVGAKLADSLFSHGVEFPCGGRGRCKGCRVRVESGNLAVTDDDRRALGGDLVSQGWRLACRATVSGDMVLALARYEAAVLSDDSAFSFTPRDGFGVAVDLGTTTLVAQLIDLRTGAVRGVRTGLNPQARFGGDVVSRLEHACGGGAGDLRGMIHRAVGEMVAGLSGGRRLARVVIVGNSAMHHLFCGLDCTPLALHPFEPSDPNERMFAPSDLHWDLAADEIVFLPCLGGMVGSDILAGIVATDLAQRDGVHLLMDLGTNGEVVAGGKNGLLCASTAAGPAFEGARIGQGMRAATGAISRVESIDGTLKVAVIGGGPARGICGSGLVDAVAVGLDAGWILPSGRFEKGRSDIPLTQDVRLIPRDVRELQLAKGAIAAGAQTLLCRLGVAGNDVAQVHLAGAFGNYVSRRSARRTGLVQFPHDRIATVGNSALLGAKLALFTTDPSYADLRRCVTHVPLRADAEFEDRFIECMAFPEAIEESVSC